jgi:hypothetical protein
MDMGVIFTGQYCQIGIGFGNLPLAVECPSDFNATLLMAMMPG